MPLSDTDARKLFDDLANALVEARLKWVVDQTQEQIDFGKFEEKSVAQLEEIARSPDHGRADESWMSYWLSFSRLVREDLLGQSSGTAIPGLNGTKIKATRLPEIPLEEQHRVVTYLDNLQAKVDRLKALQQQTSAELDALLPSILDRAFKGEL